MKKIIVPILSLVLILSLAGCGSKNSLLKNAYPETSQLVLYMYDGDTFRAGILPDIDAEKEVLRELSSVSAKKVDDWSPEKVSAPIYALEIRDKKSNPIQGAWSNGYWIAMDGTAYSFDFDFTTLSERFERAAYVPTLSEFPCARFFSQDGDTWIKDMLTPSELFHIPDEGNLDITVSVKSLSDDSITLELESNEILLWSFYALDRLMYLTVLLDDIQYIVPYMPGDWLSQGIELTPMSATEATIDSACLGDLPPGEYRLISHNMSFPFTVE